MKLATKTGDFLGYTGCQIQAMQHIRKANFRYADYSFGPDHKNRSGIYAGDLSYFDQIAQTAEDLGLRLIQAHAPMGRPLADPDGSFLAPMGHPQFGRTLRLSARPDQRGDFPAKPGILFASVGSS